VQAGKTVMFTWIAFKNHKHRDQVNQKVRAGPRMGEMSSG